MCCGRGWRRKQQGLGRRWPNLLGVRAIICPAGGACTPRPWWGRFPVTLSRRAPVTTTARPVVAPVLSFCMVGIFKPILITVNSLPGLALTDISIRPLGVARVAQALVSQLGSSRLRATLAKEREDMQIGWPCEIDSAEFGFSKQPTRGRAHRFGHGLQQKKFMNNSAPQLKNGKRTNRGLGVSNAKPFRENLPNFVGTTAEGRPNNLKREEDQHCKHNPSKF